MDNPTEREQVAKAAFDSFYADGTPYSQIEHAMFLQVADAVMAVVSDVWRNRHAPATSDGNPCPECNGSGIYVQYVDYFHPPQSLGCPDCEGTGMVPMTNMTDLQEVAAIAATVRKELDRRDWSPQSIAQELVFHGFRRRTQPDRGEIRRIDVLKAMCRGQAEFDKRRTFEPGDYFDCLLDAIMAAIGERDRAPKSNLRKAQSAIDHTQPDRGELPTRAQLVSAMVWGTGRKHDSEFAFHLPQFIDALIAGGFATDDMAAIGDLDRVGELVHLAWEDANELNTELTQDGYSADGDVHERFHDELTRVATIRRNAILGVPEWPGA